MKNGMSTQLRNFKIIIEDSYEALSQTAAVIYAEEIKAKPEGIFGFATGGTPVGMYERLISIYNDKTQELDFSGITTFNLDEYYPINKDNTQSYSYFMRKNLFDHVNVKPININIPDGQAPEYEAECRRYSDKIYNCGNIDLQLLGIGNNGHIGFNEPDDHFAAHTHFISLAQSTIDANARYFDTAEDVPRNAITMGIREIMMAKKILLLVSGSGKAQITYDILLGPITPQVPASVLQLHHNVTVVMDNAAAEKILQKL